MISRKSVISLIVVLVLLFTSVISFAAYSSYSVVFRGAYDGSTRWGSPIKNNSGTSVWPTITSKWGEQRSTGTSPHVGVDLSLSQGKKIAAVHTGSVKKVADDYSFNTISQRYYYTSLYCHYEHMDSITASGWAYKGDVLGIGGDYGTSSEHLHFGAYDKDTMSGRKAYRNETFYRNVSTWNYGRNVDVYSQCQFVYGNTAKITAVYSGGWQNTHDELPASVRIYHRKQGDVSWIDGGIMSRSGFTYSYTFSSSEYPNGSTVEWLVRIERNISSSKKYTWAPSKYYNPSSNPNSTSNRYDFFTNTIY